MRSISFLGNFSRRDAMRAWKAGLVLSKVGSVVGGGGRAMGEIFWTMILRPPCSWIWDSRISSSGIINLGFGGSGGGEVPSGSSPMMRAVVGGEGDSSGCENTGGSNAIKTANTIQGLENFICRILLRSSILSKEVPFSYDYCNEARRGGSCYKMRGWTTPKSYERVLPPH